MHRADVVARGSRRRPLSLASEIVYGPIRSRRLGVSLGINLLPTTHKVCSFDCIYCHYGHTDAWTMAPDPEVFPTVHEVLAALAPALRRCQARSRWALDNLTFSGNGEPTLHPYFAEIVFEVQRLRDRLAPDAKIALFSNATTITRPEIRSALARMDAPMLKLDAGDAGTLARINRPAPGVIFEDMVAALKDVPNLVIQSVLVGGVVNNSSGDALNAWVARIAEIQPAAVQIYSTDYPVPTGEIQRVPPYMLRRLADETQQCTGVPVRAYWPES